MDLYPGLLLPQQKTIFRMLEHTLSERWGRKITNIRWIPTVGFRARVDDGEINVTPYVFPAVHKQLVENQNAGLQMPHEQGEYGDTMRDREKYSPIFDDKEFQIRLVRGLRSLLMAINKHADYFDNDPVAKASFLEFGARFDELNDYLGWT